MKKILSVHPDALYDAVYLEEVLDTEDYEPCLLAYKGEAKRKNGVTILTETGHCLILESCFDNALRFRITKPGDAVRPTTTEETNFSYVYENNTLVFSNKTLVFTFDFETGDYAFSDKSGKNLLKTVGGGARFSKHAAEYSGIKSYTAFEHKPEEKFAGFGGRMFHPDRTGQRADIFSEKGGAKVGDYGGFPVPYFTSSEGYGVFFNNPWPHVYFDMAKSSPDEWFISAPGGDYDLFVFSGEHVADILKTYTQITGRNGVPDKWHLGYWCSSVRFDSAGCATEGMLRMRNEGFPCDAVVIDGPWRGGKDFISSYTSGWGYPSDDYNWHSDFGDGPGMISKLEENGIKTVLHINSCAFKPETAIPAIAEGKLRQVKSEVVPDVATESGIAFYKTFLVPRIKDGVKQWWTDHSDRVSGEILPGIPSRNLFGVLWNRVITETMAENGIQNHMSLSRGGGIGSQRYAMPWAGDTEFGIHRFKEDVWYVINASMAGFSMCGYDLGGFMRRNKQEGDANEQQFDMDNICRRMCQSLIFCPMPRMHNGDNAVPKWPWNCPKESRRLYKECLEFRYRFIPNIYSYALKASKTGEPIIRPRYYDDYKNTKLYAMDDSFYLGDDILIAPVFEKGAVSRNVDLPKGNWYHLWTNTCYQGETTVSMDCPLTEKEGLPIFIREGGGVAYQAQTMYFTNDIPGKLTIDLYAKEEAALQLYEAPEIVNRFSCNVHENGVCVEAENNSCIQRVYHIHVITPQKTYSVTKVAAPGEVIKEEIR